MLLSAWGGVGSRAGAVPTWVRLQPPPRISRTTLPCLLRVMGYGELLDVPVVPPRGFVSRVPTVLLLALSLFVSDVEGLAEGDVLSVEPENSEPEPVEPLPIEPLPLPVPVVLVPFFEVSELPPLLLPLSPPVV